MQAPRGIFTAKYAEDAKKGTRRGDLSLAEFREAIGIFDLILAVPLSLFLCVLRVLRGEIPRGAGSSRERCGEVIFLCAFQFLPWRLRGKSVWLLAFAMNL
jgi:hypothetical protein